MPNPLSETQARQVREEIRRQLRPWKVYIVALVVGIAIGAAGGVYAYTTSFGYARNVSCQRARAFSIALNLVVHSFVPRHAPNRTKAQQAFVDRVYKRVGPALKVPSCN